MGGLLKLIMPTISRSTTINRGDHQKLLGKKLLSERTHICPVCGYTTNRDVAAAQVIRNRGKVAVGQPVKQNACGDVLTGADQASPS